MQQDFEATVQIFKVMANKMGVYSQTKNPIGLFNFGSLWKHNFKFLQLILLCKSERKD